MTVEYICTNRKIIEKIHLVQMTAGDSFSMLRDHKQVPNVAQKVTECKVCKFNEAYKLQHFLGRIHKNQFIKEVCVHQAQLAIIIGFTEKPKCLS